MVQKKKTLLPKMTDISEQLKNKSEAIKNIVVAAAVVIGGAWTLYTFWSLQSSHKAAAELEELNTRIFRQPVLQIEFNIEQKSLANDPSNYLTGYVYIKNIGKRNAMLKFKNDNPPFSATQVSFDSSGEPLLGKKYAQYPPKYAGYSIRVGDSEKIPFFLRVGDPGLYFVDFDVKVSEQPVDGDGESSDLLSWSSSKYIEVK